MAEQEKSDIANMIAMVYAFIVYVAMKMGISSGLDKSGEAYYISNGGALAAILSGYLWYNYGHKAANPSAYVE